MVVSSAAAVPLPVSRDVADLLLLEGADVVTEAFSAFVTSP